MICTNYNEFCKYPKQSQPASQPSIQSATMWLFVTTGAIIISPCSWTLGKTYPPLLLMMMMMDRIWSLLYFSHLCCTGEIHFRWQMMQARYLQVLDLRCTLCYTEWEKRLKKHECHQPWKSQWKMRRRRRTKPFSRYRTHNCLQKINWVLDLKVLSLLASTIRVEKEVVVVVVAEFCCCWRIWMVELWRRIFSAGLVAGVRSSFVLDIEK